MQSESEITRTELADLLASASPPVIVEVLGRSHYESGHLPGALHLPLEGLVENAPRVLPDQAASIVAYCASATCQNSFIAQRKLRALGYLDVRVLAGGKAEWKAAGGALEGAPSSSAA
jgi:rhodanese-related sulfurtransferase